MKKIESIKINAPINRVFDYITNPEKQKLWLDGLINTEYITPFNIENPNGIHFKQHLIKGHRKSAYEFQGEIVDYQKPSVYAIKIADKTFDAEIRYELKEIDGQTQLDTITEMEFHGNLFSRFIGRMAEHHNKQDMKKLITLLEKVQ